MSEFRATCGTCCTKCGNFVRHVGRVARNVGISCDMWDVLHEMWEFRATRETCCRKRRIYPGRTQRICPEFCVSAVSGFSFLRQRREEGDAYLVGPVGTVKKLKRFVRKLFQAACGNHQESRRRPPLSISTAAAVSTGFLSFLVLFSFFVEINLSAI